MQILVNGAAHDVSAAATLLSALSELGFADAVVATAVNGEFVPAGRRAQIVLSQGDQLEVLAPMQGG